MNIVQFLKGTVVTVDVISGDSRPRYLQHCSSEKIPLCQLKLQQQFLQENVRKKLKGFRFKNYYELFIRL